ncbi:p-loop domain-containing protein [Desulfonema limicola]|uniref:P-loop domain-containing protein n=1 Tax=Desulfonema limicola TaxID=45656 RepID=A0A975BEC9_9BACT|nr:hypothetical protein [Desulfonema limicola]QTA83763.1 p-loop domain-containing protein [Desulfonema limicola]
MELKLQDNEELSVNRVDQIDDVEKRLADIGSGKKVFDVIIEWFGIPGIGKTTLTQDLIVKLCKEKSVVFACIDFDSEFNKNADSYSKDTVFLLEDIVEKFDRQDKADFTSALYKYRDSPNENLKKKRKLKVINEYVNYVKMLSKDKPIVIIFDTTEKIAPDLFAWMEKEIISPLSLTGKCIFILTGRFPLRWRQFEVRRRVISNKLEPLDQEFTNRQVGETKSNIYQFTFGHPLTNKTLSKKAADFKEKNQTFDKKDMINIMDNVLESYVMKDITDTKLKDACRVLAIVRQFDVIIMRHLLTQFEKEHFQETEGFLEISGQLSETFLIEWNSKLKGYALDETVRHMLSLNMQFNDIQRYKEINKSAADIYKEWIEKVSENRSIYILERFYHLTNIAKIEDKNGSEIGAELEKELQGFLTQYYQKNKPEFDYAATIRLYEELLSDHELEKLVGEGNFAKLKEIVNNHLLYLIKITKER